MNSYNGSDKALSRDDGLKDLMNAVLSVRRVTKIVRGGACFSFSVLVIVGDQEGRVGVASGKDKELSNAKIKALRRAKNKMIHIPLRYGKTIHHDIKVKYGASIVMMKSASEGSGVIAGSVLRTLFECLGVKDVIAKSYGSSNKYNMIFAALKALKLTSSPRKIAERRGIKGKVLIAQRIGVSY